MHGLYLCRHKMLWRGLRMASHYKTKPPTLFIFANDNDKIFERYLNLFKTLVNTDFCIFHHLQQEQILNSTWSDHGKGLILTAKSGDSQVNSRLEQAVQTKSDFKVLNFVPDVGYNFSSALASASMTSDLNKSVRIINVEDVESVDQKLLQEVLVHVFGLEKAPIEKSDVSQELSKGYFIGSDQDMLRLRSHLSKSASIELLESPESKPRSVISSKFFPVVLSADAVIDAFNGQEYLEHLKTKILGRPCLYFETMTSSFDFFHSCQSVEVLHGLAIVPGRQTQGRGRSGNIWLSPKGCAMFTLQLVMSTKSVLGQRISILCQLVTIAVVKAIRDLSSVPVGIKWPNDIYYQKEAKLGGVAILTSFMGHTIVANVGVGINLDNEKPVLALNDLVQDQDPISKEELLATIFNNLEQILDQFQSGDDAKIVQMYYDYWIHSDQVVQIRSGDDSKQAKVESIDEFGFLQVRMQESGLLESVQPDGNSFDMFQGLICPKLK